MVQHPEAPVLLVTFNRPDYTRQVFEQIRKARISRLYVFNDGPRAGNADDEAARTEIRGLLQEIDWPCELQVLFPEKNLGCAVGVSSAISWVFQHEERAIILEDDTVPSLAFFTFCREMLEQYKNDTRVWMVSANNYNEEYQLPASYTFSRSAIHIWGWATWKRCWNHYNISLDAWPPFSQAGGFSNLFGSKTEIDFWTQRYERLYGERETVTRKTWDYQYVLSLLINGGLCIVPAKNLVTNIGLTGTHTGGAHAFHNRPVDDDFLVRQHPDFILANAGYDSHHVRSFWKKKKPVTTRINNKLKKILSR
jgi:GT2 family glycosyltransferase